jgi:hypothetical protein
MNRNLLTPISSLFTPPSSKSFGLLLTLVMLLNFGISNKINAQCIGPYARFESFAASGTNPAVSTASPSFTTSSTTTVTFGSSGTIARSGVIFCQTVANAGWLMTPVITNPKTFSFYIKTSSAPNGPVNYLLEYSTSTDGFVTSTPFANVNTIPIANATTTLPSVTTSYQLVSVTFLTNLNADVKFRITDTNTRSATPGPPTSYSGQLHLDDFFWDSFNSSFNNVIVPATTGNGTPTNCTGGIVNVAANSVYNFYDNGGASDQYNANQTNQVTFKPVSASDKIKITIVSYTGVSNELLEIWDDDGTNLVAANLVINNNTGTIAAGTQYNSTISSNGAITIKFTSNSIGNAAGFNIKVECPGVAITSLGTSSGCQGASLVINGTGFTGAVAANIKVGGTPVSSIQSNTGTVLTVIPASGSSGPVSVTNGNTVSFGSYTVNPLPTVTASSSVCVGSSITLTPTTGGTWSSSDTTKATVTNAGVVTGVAAGSATFTFLNTTTNCSATTSSVTVNALPVVSSGASVCVGSQITLSPTIGGSWSSSDTTKATVTNAGVVTGVAAGSVTFTFANTTTNCSATTSSLSVIGITNTLTTTTPQSYCLNATTVTPLSVTATTSVGVISYQWYSNTIASTTGSPIAVGTNSNTYTPLTTSPGTLYYYCVVTNTAGCSATSAVSGAVTVANLPVAPTLSITNPIGGSSFRANWLPVSGATGYYLEVSTNNTFASFVTGYSDLFIGNVTSYPVTGLSQGTNYYYRVRAVNGCGLGPYATSPVITTAFLTYCTPNIPTTSTTFINSFTTSSGISNISNLNTGFTTGGYANYTTQSCSQYPSSSINYTISSSATFTSDQTFFYFIWVDWNENGLFTDAGETMLNSNTTYILSPFSGSFSVPAGQPAGSYRMRVSTSWEFSNLPCTQSTRSETEDYTFIVVAVPPCAPSNPSALVASGIFANGATISWTDAAMTPNSIYNYYITTDSSTTTPSASITPTGTVTGSLSANVGGLILGTTYYFWVRSNCGTPNPWQGLGSFTTVNFIVVNMNDGNTTDCNVRFYDSGGFANTYRNNEFYTHTFNAPSGKALKIVFNSFNTESRYDGLLIYKGATLIPSGLPIGLDNVTCPQDSFHGTTSPGTIYSDIGGSITFVFRSDGSTLRNGWDATVTCVTLPVINDFSPTAVCAGTTPVPEITINGANFTGATTVSFNGVTATPAFISPTQIKVNLPLTATTGLLSVTTATVDGLATGTSSSMFTVNPIPPTPNAGSDVSVCLGTSAPLNAVSTAVISTTVLSENFNTGTWPLTWGRTNNGSQPPGDFRTTFESNASGNNGFGLGYTGYCSYFYSFFITSGVSGDMISPAINLSSYSSGSLSFWIYNSSGTDNLKVFANNNNGTYTQIGTTYATYGSWTQITISLNNFVGTGFNNVKIKFTGTSDFGFSNIAVDDIVVTGNIPAPIAWSPSTYLNSTTSLTPNVTPTGTMPSPFTYSLTTTLNGCTSLPDNVVVTVTSRPTANITGTQAVCNGNTANVSIALTGTAPWSITYFNGTASTTVSGILTNPYTITTPALSSATTYTITALSDSKCSAAAGGMTGSAVVSIITPPTVTFAASAASVCFNFASQTTTLAYSATTGSPATYSIIWGAGYTPSGFVTMTDAPFPAGASGTINVTVPPGADNSVVNTATVVVKNAQGCISASYSFSLAVNSSPAVTMTVSSQTKCFSASSQTVTYTYSGANVANSYDVTWNASPANSLQTFSNIPFPSSTGSITINVPAGTPGGTYIGTVTPRNSGCGIGAAPRTITLIISQPSITPAASAAAVCITAGAQTTTLVYSNPTATPTSYSITWSNVPSNPFAPVNDAIITASPLIINIPAGTAANTYTGSISVKNGNNCVSPGTNFTVVVNDKPTMTSSFVLQTVCPSTSAQTAVLSYSAVSNAATYSIDWTGLADQVLTSDAFATGNINTIAVPANLAVNQYSGTITLNSASGCVNSYPITMYVGKRWSGTTNSEWADGSNWVPQGVPVSSDCVIIPSVTPSPVIASNANCGNLTINPGATLTVNSDIALTVQDFVKTDGTLTFNNGASLLQANNVVANTNTGNITYIRKTTPLNKFDYTYWSTPVSPQTLSALSPLTPLHYGYDASIPQWVGLSALTTMVPGKGYISRAPSNFPLAPSSAVYDAFFNGVPNNGTYTTTVFGGSDQQNLLGNPYPSAINATSFVSDTSNDELIEATLYFWTHNTPINAGQYIGSDYAVWNILGGTDTSASVNPGVNTNRPNGFINAGQGFFVKGIANGNVTFKNTMRVSGNNNQFFRSSNPVASSQTAIERNRFWLDISNSEGAYKQILMGYITGGTIGLDRDFDGEMVDVGNVVTLYTMVADKKLSIQGRGLPFDVADTIPLGYKSTIDGTFTIALSDFDGLFETQNIYLEDIVTGVIHDLKSDSYTFATQSGTFEDRFVLRFTPGSLGVPVFTENTVLVYKNEAGLTINSGSIPMKSVAIYDVTGRLITSQKEIYATQTRFTTLPSTNQVLLVEITSETGVKVTKKVVY